MYSFQRYMPIIIYVGIFFAGMIVFGVYNNKSNLWDLWGALDSASAVSLAILALMGYLEYIRAEDKIKIIFDIEGKRVDTRLSVLRKNLARSEVLGLLRMIHKNQSQFHIKAFNDNPDFLDEIHKVARGRSKELVIPVTKEEAKQFKIQGNDDGDKNS